NLDRTSLSAARRIPAGRVVRPSGAGPRAVSRRGREWGLWTFRSTSGIPLWCDWLGAIFVACGAPQCAVQNSVSHELLNVCDTVVAASLKVLQRQLGLATSLIELVRPGSRVPLRSVFRCHFRQQAAVDTVVAQVG